MGRVFDCEIQARFRDLNAGWHVDSAEAVRLIDEARIQLLMFARCTTVSRCCTASRRGSST